MFIDDGDIFQFMQAHLKVDLLRSHQLLQQMSRYVYEDFTMCKAHSKDIGLVNIMIAVIIECNRVAILV